MRTTKEILANFYKDIHSFICAYNPSYFRSLKLNEQRALLTRVLPAISSKEAFELLSEKEREILESPIEDIKNFNKNRRAENKELNSELDMLKGSKATYVNIAIQREEALKEFDKANELKQLENEFEKIISNSDQMLSLDELEADIKKLNEIINNNIKIKLVKLQENQKNELKKLEDVSSLTATCPTCRQEIKNENMINALKIGFKRNINELADNIENLKQETKGLLEKRNNQIENYKLMKTPEMQDLSKKREILKEKIDNLYKEKNEIDLSNRETMIKNNVRTIAVRHIAITSFNKNIIIANSHLLLPSTTFKNVAEIAPKIKKTPNVFLLSKNDFVASLPYIEMEAMLNNCLILTIILKKHATTINQAKILKNPRISKSLNFFSLIGRSKTR